MTNRALAEEVDERYKILFEPVSIGPKIAPNRFYQVPHGSGMGFRHPQSLAAMRGVKAEGGWGVVSSEYTTIHQSMDNTPAPFAALWTEQDIRANALVADAIHEHGSLSAVELCITGNATGNLLSRTPSYDVSSTPIWDFPWQTRRADKQDIANIRLWHKEAAKRAVIAGHDIVYVYATHGYFLSNFISPESNTRSDEYGGSLENRIRIVREIIEDTKEAVGDQCAVAVRLAVDQGLSASGVSDDDEAREILSLLADLPDLWDLNIHDWYREIGPSRFYQEGMLEEFVSYARSIVKQPIVSTGRFTSPDTMVRQVKSGVLDFIGAARPSIADPFLPNKIKQSRLNEIRECIGCNICYTGTHLGHPIRCTQNPSMGLEWQRGWHPEYVPESTSENTVLVVGSGPAGLEAALTAAKRGYQVALAEANNELGGRVSKESRLPGLNQWARVREYREQQLRTLSNVEIYLDSELSADQIIEFGFNHVVLATGAVWRDNGLGRSSKTALFDTDSPALLSVNRVLNQEMPSHTVEEGPVLIYDDDDYYMAAVIALKMRRAGFDVVLVCTKGTAGDWSQFTEERYLVNAELINEGVEIVNNTYVSRFAEGMAYLNCKFSNNQQQRACATLIPVTSREPNDTLYCDLMNRESEWQAAGILSIARTGDCLAPGIIAQAVHGGRETALEFDNESTHHEVREIQL